MRALYLAGEEALRVRLSESVPKDKKTAGRSGGSGSSASAEAFFCTFFENGGVQGFTSEAQALAGTDPEEIFRLREYEPGDSLKSIHWNQTARTGRLWVKEYSRDREQTVSLILRSAAPGRSKGSQREPFYEVLYAVLLGLLEQECFIAVYGKTKGGTGQERLLRSREDCNTLMLLLYRSEQEWLWRKDELSPETELCLETNLTLVFRGRTLYQFSEEHYGEELEALVLS